ncbi:MAG TPA: nodulation protein NfeD [Longimicrobiales bacterium]|nr:nodulation protein NfeD [Longimicrobiales bacterium]
MRESWHQILRRAVIRSAARLTVSLLALITVFAPGSALAQAGGGEVGGRTVYRVPVTGVIELGLAPFIERSLREAAEAGADAIVLEIETLGGRVDAAQRIANALGDSPVPTYAYINRRAISAGAMIALATDRIFMREGAVMGAATPVTADGEYTSEKIVSAMRSEMRALAESHGLDPAVAEAMVDEDVEIPGVIEAGKLLTLTTDEAEQVGYATRVVDWDDVMRHIGMVGADVRTTEVNWAESLVRFLTHPIVSPLLLTIGMLGLIFEIKSPGFGLPGIAGVLGIGLFFGSHVLVGLAGWEELILLGIGAVLLGIEIFVVPGFGIFGIAGILGILSSMYLSMIGDIATRADFGQAAGALSASLLAVIALGWVLVRRLPRSRRLEKSGIVLAEETRREGGYVSIAARSDLVGATGTALTDLRPAGAAEFNGERVDVVADANWIPAGTPIRVVRSEGYRIVVRPVT